VEAPAAVRALAEDGNAITPDWPGEERVVSPRFTMRTYPLMSPPFHIVCRIRLAPDAVDAAVEEVRAILRARPVRGSCEWEVGSSATPSGLAERLAAHGILPNEGEPTAGAMALLEPPRLRAEPGWKVRRVATPLEAAAASEIQARSFLGEEPWSDERRAEAIRDASARPPIGDWFVSYIAWLDDRPVAAAAAMFCEAGVICAGGATIPEARGRGAYTALVAARWNDAVARGTPALVCHAGKMSRPILEKLGFVAVGEMQFHTDSRL
jgi:hypothetical protein